MKPCLPISIAGVVLALSGPAAFAEDWGLLVNKTGSTVEVNPLWPLKSGYNTTFVLTLMDVTGNEPEGPSLLSNMAMQVLMRSHFELLPDHAVRIEIANQKQGARTLPLVLSRPKKAAGAGFEFNLVYTCNKAGEEPRSFLSSELQGEVTRADLPFDVIQSDGHVLTLVPHGEGPEGHP